MLNTMGLYLSMEDEFNYTILEYTYMCKAY